jgi:DNA polymerase-1
MPALLIVDFANLVHRSYYGYPEMRNTDGVPVHGAFGTGQTILRLIDLYRPTHVIAAMDAPRAQLRRREIVADYKDHREPAEADMRTQFHLAQEVIAGMGIVMVGAPGEEADDVAATLARRFPEQVIIATGDRDLFGAITSDGRVGVHLMGHDALIDAEGCTRLFGVPPHLVSDFKALVGDSSDGYPGVRGIGPKAAQQILTQCGSLAEAIKMRDYIPGMAGRRFREGMADAERYYALATLNADAEIPPVKARWIPQPETVARLMEMEMPTLAERFRVFLRSQVGADTH